MTINNLRKRKISAITMAMALLFASLGFFQMATQFASAQTASTTPTIDLKVNGSDGPVVLTSGSTYTYSWVSTNATACLQTSPLSSGVDTNGNTSSIGVGHPFYPSVGSSVTITISCTDGTTSVSDSVVVSLGAAAVASSTPPTIDVTANGSQGPVTLNPGQTFTYSWTSANATACLQTAPATSGVDLTGNTSAIGPGHPFYPTVSANTTITISCTDGTTSASDSVVVRLASAAISTSSPTIDVKVNGSDGPVVLTQGQTYNYTWVSANATACLQTSPTTSGVDLSGASASIMPGHPFYPSTSASTTITVSCTDGITSATDSVVVGLAPANLVCPLPVLTLSGDANMIVFTSNPFTDPGVSVTGGTSSSTTNLNLSVPGTYTITYTAVGCGGTTTATRTVQVIAPGGGGGGGSSVVTSPGSSSGGVGGIGGETTLLPIAYTPVPFIAAIPGIPSTGAGGDLSKNIMVLLGSGILTLGGLAYLVRLRKKQTL